MNRRYFIIVGFLALVVYLVGFRADTRFLKIVTDQAAYRFDVEVVRTLEEKQMGLIGRTELMEGAGMLFVYEEGNSRPVMWMKDMLIPIDMIFIGSDLKISYIAGSVKPCAAKLDRQCNRYGAASSSAFVLEIAAGLSAKYGIVEGDQIILPSGI